MISGSAGSIPRGEHLGNARSGGSGLGLGLSLADDVGGSVVQVGASVHLRPPPEAVAAPNLLLRLIALPRRSLRMHPDSCEGWGWLSSALVSAILPHRHRV